MTITGCTHEPLRQVDALTFDLDIKIDFAPTFSELKRSNLTFEFNAT